MRSKRMPLKTEKDVITNSLNDLILKATSCCHSLLGDTQNFEENKVTLASQLSEIEIIMMDQRLNDTNGFHKSTLETQLAFINETLALSTAQGVTVLKTAFEDFVAELTANCSALKSEVPDADISGDASHFTE